MIPSLMLVVHDQVDSKMQKRMQIRNRTHTAGGVRIQTTTAPQLPTASSAATPHPAAPADTHPLSSQQYPSGPQPRPQMPQHLLVGAQPLASVHPTYQPLTAFQPPQFQLLAPQLPTHQVTTPSSQNPFLTLSNPFLP